MVEGNSLAQSKKLLYTLAFDEPGAVTFAIMAKLLVASLVRTRFSGEIVVFHNGENLLFPCGRPRVTEIRIETNGDEYNYARTWKYEARQWIEHEQYEVIFFADCDCLAFANIESLYTPATDVGVLREDLPRNLFPFRSYLKKEELDTSEAGINSGFWWVKGALYEEMMVKWEAVRKSAPVQQGSRGDQPAWNRIVFDMEIEKVCNFNSSEVCFPFTNDSAMKDREQLKFAHFCGVNIDSRTKLSAMLGEYVRTFFGDRPDLLLAIIEP